MKPSNRRSRLCYDAAAIVRRRDQVQMTPLELEQWADNHAITNDTLAEFLDRDRFRCFGEQMSLLG